MPAGLQRPSPYGVLAGMGGLPALAQPMPTPGAGLPVSQISTPPLAAYTPGANVGGYSPPTPTPPAGVGLNGSLVNVPSVGALQKWDTYLANNTHNYMPPPSWYQQFRRVYGGGGAFGMPGGGGNGTGPSNGTSGGLSDGGAGHGTGGGVGPGTGGVY